MDQSRTTFIELPIYKEQKEESFSCKKVKDKCCKKYKKKGKHCKKCPRLLLSDPIINFASKKLEAEA